MISSEYRVPVGLRRLLRRLRLEGRLDLLEALDHALANRVEGLSPGLLKHLGQLTEIGDAGFEGFLGGARLLGELVFGAADAYELLGQLGQWITQFVRRNVMLATRLINNTISSIALR